MKALLYGYYATRVYLPFSGWSRDWQRFRDRLRDRQSTMLQQIALPTISWRRCTAQRAIRIWERGQVDGNIRFSELGVLSGIAAGCEAGTILFEIGIFDGRTTLNLALSSPVSCRVATLDLPPDGETRFALVVGEKHLVEKERSGDRYEKHRTVHKEAVGKIFQYYGDSAAFDYAPFANRCSLVFVDGSHAYDYVISDTAAAMNMVKDGGVILWHDYGVWPGVTKALEEIEANQGCGLKNIRGTSLVYWRKPEQANR